MDYEHYNRSLGVYIKNKRHYKEEMKRQGMVSFEEGEDLARKARERAHKDYKPTQETMKFLKHVESRSKDGKVKLSGRELQYMEKIGVNFKRPEYKGIEGGF